MKAARQCLLEEQLGCRSVIKEEVKVYKSRLIELKPNCKMG